MAEPSVTAIYYRGLAQFTDGNLALSERDFRAVLERRPAHAGALHYAGLVSQQSGRTRRALRLLRQSVAADPRSAVYQLNLGNLFHQLKRTRDAIVAWEAAGRLDNRLEDAFTNVGLTCAEIGDHHRAAEAFSRVTEINPDSAGAFRRLAAALRQLGRIDEARQAEARARALSRDPRALVRFAAARWRAVRPDECLIALRRAVRIAPGDAEVHFQLASALANTGRTAQALKAYARVLSIDPRHASARFRAAALRGEAPPLPPSDYVERVFDAFSTFYDEHMIGNLRYRGPALLWRAVRRVLDQQRKKARGLTVLDAGCGTGLAAGVLRGAARRLVGVDLSPGMVAKARLRGAYDQLIVGDLARILEANQERFDLIFSSDVFNYFGDLSIPIRAAAGSLKSGGMLAFTLEAGNGTGYAITRSGRYTHSPAFVRATGAACGFVARHIGTGTPRYERGMPVRATVAVLQRE